MERSGLKKKTVIILLISSLTLFAVTISAFSQTGEELAYPTLLSVKYRDGLVLIDFESVAGETTQHRIYRSKYKIQKNEDLKMATPLAEITGKSLPYKDAPDEDGKYYYAVTFIKDGNEITELVPFQNITVKPVDYSPIPEPVQTITVTYLDNHLLGISFTPKKEEYTYNLYVSSQRIVYTPLTDPFSILSKDDDLFRDFASFYKT